MSISSDKIRKGFGESDAKRDAGLTTPNDIKRYDDILYGTDKTWNILDVYRPKEFEGKKLPVIVSVHGGGWVYGDKNVYQFYCMSLAQRGFAVVNFTYRLAPEYKFPAPLEDTNTVFGWILKNAEEYGFDTDNIFAVGDSAGAQTLGLYADIYANKEYAQNYDFTVPSGLKLKAIALNCGVYDVDTNNDYDGMRLDVIKDYLPNQGSREEIVRMNVAYHMTHDFPPTFFMTCTGDFLMPQAQILEKALISNAVPHEFHFYGSYGIDFGHVFHCNVKTERAKLCNDDECEYFKKYMKKSVNK
jgi:acetyl esterase/lipase